MSTYDLVVVGAGPGGLAAAISGQRSGLSVLLLNEQQHLGGQIYHSIERVRPENQQILGKDYLYGQNLVAAFQASGATCISGAPVLEIVPEKFVCYQQGEATFKVPCKKVILSTGAVERPVPIPGWTLPGVMGAASVDVLLKQANVIPSGKVVFAGSGPLLLSVACHLIDCGVEVDTVLDTSSLGAYLKAVSHLAGALSKPGLLLKGLQMLIKMKRAGVRFIHGVHDIEAIGEGELEAIRFRTDNWRVEELNIDLLLLHEGVIPNVQLSRAIGCKHEWYDLQRYWRPVVDKWGRSSVSGVYLVGDCTGIYGAAVAENAGHLAGLDAAYQYGRLTEMERNARSKKYFYLKEKDMKIRPFIDQVYPPNLEMIVPKNKQTVVCRCEEVTVADIQSAMDEGYLSPATIKNRTRSGMGRCQGRMCGITLAELIAERRAVSPEEVGYYSIRPFLKPVTLGALANMKEIDQS